LSCDIKSVNNYKKLRVNAYNRIELLLKTKEIIKIKRTRTRELARDNENANKKT